MEAKDIQTSQRAYQWGKRKAEQKVVPGPQDPNVSPILF